MEYLQTKITSAREAMTIFKILGVKDITTDRQRKNGTTVYELPISQVWQSLEPKPLRFATYSTGYVRNVTEGIASPYQINKTKPVAYESGMIGKKRIMMPHWEDRIVYLAKFIVKNYYQKPTYVMSDHVMKCLREAYHEQNKTGLPFGDDIQVIINGHRYNLS